MGPEFTLLRFDAAVDVTALELAARHPAIFYGGALVLSRPDQQVAWHGDRLPADPLALIDRIRGAAN